MENFYQISAEPLFMTARKRARADCTMTNEMQDNVLIKEGGVANLNVASQA